MVKDIKQPGVSGWRYKGDYWETRDRARFNELPAMSVRADLYTLPDDLTEIVHGPDK